MPHRHHPELEGEPPQVLYTFQLKRSGQILKERLAWVLVGLALGIAGATVLFSDLEGLPAWPWAAQTATVDGEDPFLQGSRQAMTAAELTQTAEFKEEWVEVLLLWQQAIASMKNVPQSHPNRALAQQKVEEYERNLQYAQSNIDTRASRTPNSQNYWTLGSDRDWVLAIQGTPSQILRYDASCKEVFRYDNSIVELQNGYVKQYSNLGGNLKVLVDAPLAQSTQGTAQTWTLGSSREVVLQVQGMPSRTDQYASEQRVTFYYGNSSVLLENNYVISYLNADQNLRVTTALAAPLATAAPAAAWSAGASRAEVLRGQKQTPQAVSRNDSSCEEVLYFGNSEVILRQGLVMGYKNDAQDLQVQ